MSVNKRRFSIAAFLSLLLSAPLAAQSDDYVSNHNLQGVVPFGTYQFEGIDNINLGTGALNVNLPLYSRRGRGMDYYRALSYSSKIWSGDLKPPLVVPGGLPYIQMAVGDLESFRWRINGPELGVLELQYSQQACPNNPGALVNVLSDFVFRSGDGASYQFPNRIVTVASGICNMVPGLDVTQGTSDSGVLRLFTPASTGEWWIRLKDGSKITLSHSGASAQAAGVTRVTDANGNYISLRIDTLGRAQSDFTYKDSSGTTRTFAPTYSNVAYTPDLSQVTASCTGAGYSWPGTRTVSALTRLDLPNGLKYQFQYDPKFGALRRIDLPAGGYIRWEYVTIQQFDVFQPRTVRRLDSRRVSKRAVSADGVHEDVWTYSYQMAGGHYITTVYDPMGNKSVYEFENDGVHQLEADSYQGASTLLRSQSQTWANTNTSVRSLSDLTLGFRIEKRSWRVVQSDDVQPNGLASRRTMVYDTYTETFPNTFAETRMNVKEERVFGYGSGAPGAEIRKAVTSYLHEADAAYASSSVHILDRPHDVDTYSGGVLKARRRFRYDQQQPDAAAGVVQHDYAGYPPAAKRGNLDRTEAWLDTTATRLPALMWHDELGNAVKTRNPRGYETTVSYLDSWAAGTTCHSGSARAFPTGVTNAKGHVSSRKYFSCSSMTASVTDPNLRVFSFSYDPLDRLSSATAPDGGTHARFYSDVNLTASRNGAFVFDQRTNPLPVRTRSYSQIEGTLDKVDTIILDGLGRIVYAGVRNGGAQSDDWIRGEYDPDGRRFKISNPVTENDPSALRDGPSSSGIFLDWTITDFDALGRAVKVTHPDGSFAAGVWSSNTVTLADEADNGIRLLTYDALDRLTSVREASPGTGSLLSGYYDTFYAYDALDNLTGVTQSPQTRTFVYDSLSRLTSDTQPESGQTSYEYDLNGNLTKRTDARNVWVSRTYDQLDRMLSISYSDLSTGASFVYDAGTNGKGRMTSSTDAAGSLALQYDVMGRVTQQARTTLGKTVTGLYQYNAGGYLTRADWQGIPGSRAIEYDHDSRGRQTVLRSYDSGVTTTVVDQYSFSHVSAGATETTRFAANQTTERTTYNNRLQAVSRQVFRTAQPTVFLEDLSWDFVKPATVSKNNGNAWKATDLIDSTKSMAFDYDRLNRLTQSKRQDNNWSIGYAYDRWGNRLSALVQFGSPQGFIPQSALLFSNNKVSGSGFAYDAAGDLTKGTRPETYQWDVAGRMKGVNSGTVSYAYDGQDRRAVKTASGASRLYFYEPSGEVVWEFPSAAASAPDISRLYFNGKLVYEKDTSGSGAHMLYSDHLGSSRLKADAASPSGFCSDSFYPFGQQMNGTCDTHDRRFTGKERDWESGLDYFGARYYDSVLGRFGSPDPLRAISKPDPQSWNRYVYVLDNPLAFVDPTGEWPFWVHQRIYQAAFGNILNGSQMREIRKASWNSDFGAGNQDPSRAFQHSMCDPTATLAGCSGQITDFIYGRLGVAKGLSASGASLTPEALYAFGEAVHTLTDMGSPSHMSPDGTPVPWSGAFIEGTTHFLSERGETLDWFGLGQSIRLAIAGFAEAFPSIAAAQGDLDKWANRTISKYVDDYFNQRIGSGYSGLAGAGFTPRIMDETRLCALGNRAACH